MTEEETINELAELVVQLRNDNQRLEREVQRLEERLLAAAKHLHRGEILKRCPCYECRKRDARRLKLANGRYVPMC